MQNAAGAVQMPELYGQPFKHQLRAETAELSRDLWSERRAHMKTRQSLRGARAKIEVLEATIETMKQHLQGAIVEAGRDIGPAVVEKYKQSYQTAFERATTG
jgi:predicted  nucleic acid-binding Zn-ribbon protein